MSISNNLEQNIKNEIVQNNEFSKFEPLEIPALNSIIETVKFDNTEKSLKTIINTSIASTIPNTENSILNNLNEMKNYVKSTIGVSGKITLINVVLILNNLMHVVEKYNNLSGSQKKMLVLDTLKSSINDQFGNTPEEILEKQMMLMLIDNTVPSLIDTLVSSINGEIKFIKNKENKCFTSFKNLFSCKK